MNNLITGEQTLQSKIYMLRDTQVMLDKELAQLYSVKPTRLREQVKRNSKKFPKDFMVSQNAIPSKQHIFYDGQIFGASLKDLGEKWFAVSTMDINSLEIINNMSNLIKSLSLVVYNSLNNAHHSTCRVGGLFYWDNIR